MKALRILGWIALAGAIVAGAVVVAFRVSPWPSVLLIRHAFHADAVRRNEALESRRPAGVGELGDQPYGNGEREKLDVYWPPAAAPDARFPTVVWIHGGAFIAGDREDLSGYLRLLAARGYTAVAVGYAIAPGARYPAPVLEASRALAYLTAQAPRLHIDPSRIVLAGDSAGAQIAAQLAATLGDAAYAARVGVVDVPRDPLRAVVLFCGVYDASLRRSEGPFAGFLRTVLWSYFGAKEPRDDDPRFADFAVHRHVTAAFPPAFVSAGNGDPLLPQSMALVDALEKAGVPTQTLFFPADHAPALQHEYQFDVDSNAGQEAFERLLAFLSAHTKSS